MELKNWKIFFLLTFVSGICFGQQTIAPFKTQQSNTVFYVNMGNTALTTIQKTVTAACAYATSTLVEILPGSNPSDTIDGLTSACTTTQILDERSVPSVAYSCTASGCTAHTSGINPTPQHHFLQQPLPGVQSAAGATNVITDDTGNVLSAPGTVNGLGINTNNASPALPPSAVKFVNLNNFGVDNLPGWNGQGYAFYNNWINQTITAPGRNEGSGAGWATYGGYNALYNVFTKGIFNPEGFNAIKTGTGDFAIYHYLRTKFGETDGGGEAVQGLATQMIELPPCVTTIASVTSQNNFLLAGGGMSTTTNPTCPYPGDGQYVTFNVNTSTPPPTQYVTFVDNTQQPITKMTVASAVTPSDTWGTLVANIAPPVITDFTNPSSWPTVTFSLKLIPNATIPVGNSAWACGGSGGYERVLTTATGTSGTFPNVIETFTAKFLHAHNAPSGVNESGWIMFGGLCNSFNAIDFVANRVTAGDYRYPEPILGATDANTIVAENTFGQLDAPFNFGAVSFTSVNISTVTRTSGMVSFRVPNVSVAGNVLFGGATVTISGATDPTLNAPCTNSVWTSGGNVTCSQAGADITTPDAGHITAGDTGFGNSRFDLVSLAEIVDVRNINKAGASVDTSVAPAVYNPTQMLDGTLYIAPVPITISAGAAVHLYNHPAQRMDDIKFVETTSTMMGNGRILGNTYTTTSKSFNYYANDYLSSTATNSIAGYGGYFYAPNWLHLRGPWADFMSMDSAPSPFSSFINVGCPIVGCAGNYAQYNPFIFQGNGGGWTTTFQPTFGNLTDTLLGPSGYGGVISRGQTGILISGVGPGGNAQLNSNGANWTFNKPIVANAGVSQFAAGMLVGSQQVCLVTGTNCRPLQTNGVANTSQTLLNIVGGTGIAVTNTSGGVVSISATGGSGTRTCVANGCYIISPDGTIEEWGHVAGVDCTGGGYPLCTVTVTLPVAITTPSESVVTPSCVGAASVALNCIATYDSLTTTQFTFHYGSVVFVSGSGSILDGSQSGVWRLIGH